MSDDAELQADLSLATTAELIGELMKRHDGLVLVRESNTDAKGERSEVLFDFSGGVSRCIGLCVRMKAHLLNRDWTKETETEAQED